MRKCKTCTSPYFGHQIDSLAKKSGMFLYSFNILTAKMTDVLELTLPANAQSKTFPLLTEATGTKSNYFPPLSEPRGEEMTIYRACRFRQHGIFTAFFVLRLRQYAKMTETGI